jgi:hypothetical protein
LIVIRRGDDHGDSAAPPLRWIKVKRSSGEILSSATLFNDVPKVPKEGETWEVTTDTGVTLKHFSDCRSTTYTGSGATKIVSPVANHLLRCDGFWKHLSTYTAIKRSWKCGGNRVFKQNGVLTTEECFELCLLTPQCRFFSHRNGGDHFCVGCSVPSFVRETNDFTSYSMRTPFDPPLLGVMPLPTTAFVCAEELKECACDDGTVYYGQKFVTGSDGPTTTFEQLRAANHFTKKVQGTVTCNNAVWGDPLNNVPKYCYCVGGASLLWTDDAVLNQPGLSTGTTIDVDVLVQGTGSLHFSYLGCVSDGDDDVSINRATMNISQVDVSSPPTWKTATISITGICGYTREKNTGCNSGDDFTNVDTAGFEVVLSAGAKIGRRRTLAACKAECESRDWCSAFAYVPAGANGRELECWLYHNGCSEKGANVGWNYYTKMTTDEASVKLGLAVRATT